jgi:hypothetical protein
MSFMLNAHLVEGSRSRQGEDEFGEQRRFCWNIFAFRAGCQRRCGQYQHCCSPHLLSARSSEKNKTLTSICMKSKVIPQGSQQNVKEDMQIDSKVIF